MDIRTISVDTIDPHEMHVECESEGVTIWCECIHVEPYRSDPEPSCPGGALEDVGFVLRRLTLTGSNGRTVAIERPRGALVTDLLEPCRLALMDALQP